VHEDLELVLRDVCLSCLHVLKSRHRAPPPFCCSAEDLNRFLLVPIFLLKEGGQAGEELATFANVCPYHYRIVYLNLGGLVCFNFLDPSLFVIFLEPRNCLGNSLIYRRELETGKVCA